MTLPKITSPVPGSSINIIHQEGGWMVTATTDDSNGSPVVGQFIVTEAEQGELVTALAGWFAGITTRPAVRP